jgi:hypothetical protein
MVICRVREEKMVRRKIETPKKFSKINNGEISGNRYNEQ